MSLCQITLRDWLPAEFMAEFYNTRAATMLDVPVIEEISGSFAGADKPWPGTHKNVSVWCKLANGYAVGWNENPAIGWSFPVVKLKPAT